MFFFTNQATFSRLIYYLHFSSVFGFNDDNFEDLSHADYLKWGLTLMYPNKLHPPLPPNEVT
jgi:hypothetical protein